jgi:hypothetical protein
MLSVLIHYRIQPDIEALVVMATFFPHFDAHRVNSVRDTRYAKQLIDRIAISSELL